MREHTAVTVDTVATLVTETTQTPHLTHRQADERRDEQHGDHKATRGGNHRRPRRLTLRGHHLLETSLKASEAARPHIRGTAQ